MVLMGCPLGPKLAERSGRGRITVSLALWSSVRASSSGNDGGFGAEIRNRSRRRSRRLLLLSICSRLGVEGLILRSLFGERLALWSPDLAVSMILSVTPAWQHRLCEQGVTKMVEEQKIMLQARDQI